MAEEQNVPLNFDSMGLDLRVPGDRLDPRKYTLFLNVDSFRDGFVQNRRGTLEIATSQSLAPELFTATVLTMGFLLQEPEGTPTYVYFLSGTDLYYRLNAPKVLMMNSDHLRFSGLGGVIDSYKINNDVRPQAIIWDPNKRVKADGTVATSFGVAGSPKMASAVSAGAGNLDGTYDWVYVYRNQQTGSISAFSPVMADFTAALENVTIGYRNPADPQVTHIDFYRRGGTQPSGYFFVKTVVAVNFGGDATTLDDVADQDLGEEAATDQIEFANCIECPTTVRKTTDNGASYTNYTAAAIDNNPATHVDLSALDTVANGDWFVIGADLQFRKVLLQVDSVNGVPTANVNTNASVLTVEYWNGSAWTAVDNLTDGSSFGGKTISVNGLITYNFPNDWVKSTIDGVEAYHIRLSVSAVLSASVLLDGVRVSAMEIDPTVFCIHGDRVWCDDQSNLDRVWFSQRFRVEEFREFNFLVISSGTDRVRRPIALDDQMFVLTDQTAYHVVGTSEDSLQSLATGAQHGLFSKFAVAVGAGRIHYRTFDGIYILVPGGGVTKMTEVLDPLFRGIDGVDAAEQPSVQAIFNTFNQIDYERMEYFDNALYWAYDNRSGTRFEFIYDFVNERWKQTDRKVTAYMRVNHQGKLFSAHEDLFVYQREIGDQDIVGVVATNVSMDFRAAYLNFDSPEQDKNFVEMVIDLDPGGATFDVSLDFDNGNYSTTYEVTGTGRRLQFMPINQGIGIYAKNVGFRITTNNQNTDIKFYKVTFNFWTEPRELNKTSWDWSDYGHRERKYLKQLVIDLDTQGTACDVLIYIDGATVNIGSPNPTFQNVMTTTRQRIVLSMPIDTECKLAKVHVKSVRQLFQVKVYGHYFNYLVNGIEVGKDQTDWKDWGWPADKRWRQLMIDINTFGVNVNCAVEIDGVVITTFVLNTAGRRLLTRSLPANTVGKLERLVFNR